MTQLSQNVASRVSPLWDGRRGIRRREVYQIDVLGNGFAQSPSAAHLGGIAAQPSRPARVSVVVDVGLEEISQGSRDRYDWAEATAPRPNGERMSSTGSRTCSNCGELGHDVRTCDVPLNAGKCGNCGYRGHDRRNCPR